MTRIIKTITTGLLVATLLPSPATTPAESKEFPMQNDHSTSALATFAGGCFWCLESDLNKLDGVLEAVSGYTGGHVEHPTYEQVVGGKTGHVEAVQVRFDPGKVAYTDILDAFWRSIDPTDPGGQFADRGSQYKTAIYYHDESQRLAAEASKQDLDASGRFTKPVITPILAAQTFYPAEDYHQNYSETNPAHYQRYRVLSGRQPFLDAHWSQNEVTPRTPERGFSPPFTKPSPEELRATLTALQYQVTQEDGTEPPFKNAYWDNKRPGIYVDVVSG